MEELTAEIISGPEEKGGGEFEKERDKTKSPKPANYTPFLKVKDEEKGGENQAID